MIQPRPKITDPWVATPCHGTTVAASLQPPSAEVTSNEKKAVVAPAHASREGGR